jgi:hypothetical protein
MTGRIPNFDLLPQSQHFLALPRPDVTLGPLPHGLTDTTTLAAHDFDVDNRTGFMPPEPPLARLPSEWETWEAFLDSAQAKRLKLYNGPSTSDDDRAQSAAWREDVRKVCGMSFRRNPDDARWNDAMIADHVVSISFQSCRLRTSNLRKYG